jgi:protein TonB
MTTRWMLTTIAVMTLAATSPVAAEQSPAPAVAPQNPGPLERSAVTVTPENPIPRRLESVMPKYPAAELVRGTRGTVTLFITLDREGRVGEARQPFLPDYSVIETPGAGDATSPPLGPAFVESAVAAVKQWRYDRPARAPISFYVRFVFVPNQEATVAWHDARPPSRTGRGGVPGGVPGGVAGGVPGGVPGGAIPLPPPAPGTPVRVGGEIVPPKKIKDVKPVYPSEALQAKVSGIVIIEATIGIDGRVTDARIIRSIPILDEAALTAVRQWEFTPTILAGQPTPIIMSVTINFQLN